MIWSVALLVAGLALVAVGAELFVRGSARGASRLGVSPLMVGLTVVAFGTSAPEVVLSLIAAYQGRGEMALGNVVGSNVFNVLFILGAAALVAPLVVARQLVRFDVPILIGLSAIVLAMGLDGAIGRADGLLLLTGFAAYMVYTVRGARREAADEPLQHASVPASAPRTGIARDGLLFVGGLGVLLIGAHALVSGAADVARAAGMSELVVGLTILAVGTSLPEVATTIVAAIRGERDIAVGNAIGSSLFNLFLVLGASAALTGDLPVSRAALTLDLPVMLATAVATLPIFLSGFRIARWEGAVMLLHYAGYLGYVVLSSVGHGLSAELGRVMLLFVLPLSSALVIAAAMASVVRLRPGTARQPLVGQP